MFKPLLPILALTLAAPAFADPDASEGEANFKKCKSCHSIIAPDGTEIQKGGKTGPNLWGVVGRAVGSAPDFKYGDGILAANAKGVVWDEAQIVTYLADPAAWVKAATGNAAAKSKMTFKLPKTEDAEDMAAYLATLK
ncbi:MAG: c-type cytochrome [Tabrizicola flagellatus]|uniref:c-type cytochrome n=1 Tax=Tabrizicola flagellatus TaxID=2593021 RepID=UPI00391BC947